MDLTDRQWALVAPLLPLKPEKTGPGRKPFHPRPILNAIFWKFRTGAPWRELPGEYPLYQVCYHYFDTWRLSGLLIRLLVVLRRDLEEHTGQDITVFSRSKIFKVVKEEDRLVFYVHPRYMDDWQVSTALSLLGTLLYLKRKRDEVG